MSIFNFELIDNDFLYSDFVKYDYKFGDLDLMSGGGLLGNSVMNFGLFYYEIVDLLKMQEEAKFLLNMKNLYVKEHPVFSSSGTYVPPPIPPNPYETPETVFQFYGENWDGSTTTSTGYIGPPISESGDVTVIIPSGYNSKTGIYVNTTNEYLSFTGDISTVESNYVLFQVSVSQSFYGELGIAQYGIDMRKNDSSETRLRFPVLWTGGTLQHGYMYGVGENVMVLSTLTANKYNIAESESQRFIRCLILQNNEGKLFLRGEPQAVVSGGWTPCMLGGEGYFNRLNQNSSTQRPAILLHMSIHKFSSTGLVDMDWVNDYGNKLASYYNLTWETMSLYE